MTGRGGDRSTPPADMFTPATSIDGMEGLGDAGGTELIPSRTELIPSTSSSVSSSSAVVSVSSTSSRSSAVSSRVGSLSRRVGDRFGLI